ncbi:ATP-dependent zinc metalloprotease FtsH [Tetrabaena socialis]|uniref:ATP-dependent zinc metalloprotease FtsH n=1 Tax=Tetrabaena socialis TaxID=47790 RepID=A0A2J8A245_9CHLO|nr:ATP-dependent zinc metalloprotease FtsH [Tetrabaena socialis]|eukprot:PNH06599.1 ATP-dependent zinc metalloprotease FtsH [Tetrabaena socialis]
MSKQEKKESQWEKLTSSRAREFMTKDEKTGKMRDTGVRFEDIAGMGYLVEEMLEVVRMLKGDPAYTKVGARCPKGIILQGPPGTGKTYMARALAGEAGVPFFSSVGSEFVEMFAGAWRGAGLRSKPSRKSGSLCCRGSGSDDHQAAKEAQGAGKSGASQYDGIPRRQLAAMALSPLAALSLPLLDPVWQQSFTTYGNQLRELLTGPQAERLARYVDDQVPQPGPSARLSILRYHGKNKTMEGDTTQLLVKVAEATQGWSAAALANLLNEAAILTVRRNVPAITLPLVLELVENLNWGEKAPRIPDSEAKDRLAMVTAAKAVAFALTPGLEPIKSVTLWSGRRGLGPSVNFIGMEERAVMGLHPDEVELMGGATNYQGTVWFFSKPMVRATAHRGRPASAFR